MGTEPNYIGTHFSRIGSVSGHTRLDASCIKFNCCLNTAAKNHQNYIQIQMRNPYHILRYWMNTQAKLFLKNNTRKGTISLSDNFFVPLSALFLATTRNRNVVLTRCKASKLNMKWKYLQKLKVINLSSNLRCK